jgi:hypothetical protein
MGAGGEGGRVSGSCLPPPAVWLLGALGGRRAGACAMRRKSSTRAGIGSCVCEVERARRTLECFLRWRRRRRSRLPLPPPPRRRRPPSSPARPAPQEVKTNPAFAPSDSITWSIPRFSPSRARLGTHTHSGVEERRTRKNNTITPAVAPFPRFRDLIPPRALGIDSKAPDQYPRSLAYIDRRRARAHERARRQGRGEREGEEEEGTRARVARCRP